MHEAPGESDVTSEFEKHSDVELLDWMALVSEAEAEAHEALAVFFARHRNHVWRAVYRCMSLYAGSDDIEGLVLDTFNRAFLNAGKFRRKDSDEDAVRQLRHVRSWLSTIAKNLFHDWFRKRPPTVNGDDSFWGMIDAELAQASAVICPSGKIEIVQEALDQLNEREREVMRVVYSHFDPSCPKSHLPRGVLRELCDSLQTNKDNVRQIHLRARRKVEDYLKSKMEPSV